MKKHLLALFLCCPLFALAQTRPNLFVGVSINNTVSTISSSNNSYPSQNSFYVFPEVRFGANLFLEKQKNLSFRIEAMATYNVGTYNTQGSNGSSSYAKNAKIKDFSVGVNPQIVYTFNKGNSGPFYVAGGIAAYAITSNYNSLDYSSYMGGSTQLSGTESDNNEFIAIAATLKAGYVINKKFDAFIGYDIRLTKYAGLQIIGIRTPSDVTDQSVYKVGINYRLGRK